MVSLHKDPRGKPPFWYRAFALIDGRCTFRGSKFTERKQAWQPTEQTAVMRRARPWRTMSLVAVVLLLGVVAVSAFAAAPSAPTNLRVNDVAEPVGTDATPYFGWLVNDADANEIQTRYQILVATSAANLDANLGDAWDSGVVASRQQNHVVFAGVPLAADTKYFWKVRTWDKDGNVGAFSANATFVVGLITNADWSGASWIKRNTTVADDYTYYRKSVTLPAKTVRRATVFVTSVHKYALYVNGTLVGKGPAYQYAQFQYYNAFDITSLVTPGTSNLFAIFNHWFGGGQGRPTSARGVLMKAVIHYTDGTSTVVGTDATWKQSQATSWITGQSSRDGEGVGYIEKIDARNLTPTWFTPAFDDSTWTAATLIGSQPVSPWTGTLAPDLTRIVETVLTPVSITDKGGGKYVVDLGKVYAGVPRITFSRGTSGTVINMLGGYALTSAGNIDTAQNQSTTMTYIAVLNGSTFTYEPAEYLGMRFFVISNAPMAVTTANFKFVERHNLMDDTRSSFTSSNATLNAVWDLMKHSLSVCAQEQFLDTPTREKGAFLGDGAIQSIAAMPVNAERVLTRRTLGEFIQSMGQYWSTPAANVGRMNAVYPNVDGARDIPDYTQGYLVWVWEYYLQSGDRAFLATNDAAFKNIADYVDRSREPTTGLISNLLGGSGSYLNGIVDWPSSMRFGYDMTTARTVINAWAWADYDIVSRIADELGNSADRDTYRTRANALQTAMNDRLLNAGGVYVDGLNASAVQSAHASQQANAFPLALGLVPAAQRQSVITQVKALNMSVGMICAMWLVRSLGEADEGGQLLNLYTNVSQYGWARCLSLGATATWESWTANTDGGSQSHGWGAAGLEGYVRYILGVKALTPQFEEVQIKPLDFGASLASAGGTVPTDRGDIAVAWDRNAARFHLAVTIPVNVTATAYVPQAGLASTTVKVDGLCITGTVTNGYLAVSGIGSGTHIIERVLDPLFAKTQWLQTNFTTAELANPDISGDNADPDHDVIVNELEYAFGLNPKISSPGLLQPQLSADHTQFLLTFPAQRSELNYTVQTSADLHNWTPVALASTISNAIPWLTAVLNVQPNQCGFFRLTIAPTP
jgi:alpha-L-rhamnosidase